MTRRVALGAGAGAGLGTLLGASPATAASAPSQLPATLTTGAARVLGGRARPAAGDTVTSRADLRDEAGRAAGEVVVTAVVLALRTGAGEPARLETHLLRLADGTLSGHGTVDAHGAGAFAVVGGTGRHLGATGAYTVAASPTGGRTLTFSPRSESA